MNKQQFIKRLEVLEKECASSYPNITICLGEGRTKYFDTDTGEEIRDTEYLDRAIKAQATEGFEIDFEGFKNN